MYNNGIYHSMINVESEIDMLFQKREIKDIREIVGNTNAKIAEVESNLRNFVREDYKLLMNCADDVHKIKLESDKFHKLNDEMIEKLSGELNLTEESETDEKGIDVMEFKTWKNLFESREIFLHLLAMIYSCKDQLSKENLFRKGILNGCEKKIAKESHDLLLAQAVAAHIAVQETSDYYIQREFFTIRKGLIQSMLETLKDDPRGLSIIREVLLNFHCSTIYGELLLSTDFILEMVEKFQDHFSDRILNSVSEELRILINQLYPSAFSLEKVHEKISAVNIIQDYNLLEGFIFPVLGMIESQVVNYLSDVSSAKYLTQLESIFHDFSTDFINYMEARAKYLKLKSIQTLYESILRKFPMIDEVFSRLKDKFKETETKLIRNSFATFSINLDAIDKIDFSVGTNIGDDLWTKQILSEDQLYERYVTMIDHSGRDGSSSFEISIDGLTDDVIDFVKKTYSELRAILEDLSILIQKDEKRYEVFVESFLKLWERIFNELSNKLSQERELIEKRLFFGRLADSFLRLLEEILISVYKMRKAPNLRRFKADLNVVIPKKFQKVYDSLQKQANDLYVTSHEGWIVGISRQINNLLTSSSLSELYRNDNVLVNSIMSQECTKEGSFKGISNINSESWFPVNDIFIPHQPSTCTISILRYINQSYFTAGGYKIRPVVLERMKMLLSETIFSYYETLLSNNQLDNETGLLQYLFDLRYLGSIFFQDSFETLDLKSSVSALPDHEKRYVSIIRSVQGKIDPINWETFRDQFIERVTDHLSNHYLYFGLFHPWDWKKSRKSNSGSFIKLSMKNHPRTDFALLPLHEKSKPTNEPPKTKSQIERKHTRTESRDSWFSKVRLW